MKNKSGIIPLGHAVLTEPYEPERRSSVIELPPSVLANERVLDVKVRVVAVGPEAWGGEDARAYPGDVVFVARFSGFVSQGLDGQPYRLVNGRDIFAKLEVNHE